MKLEYDCAEQTPVIRFSSQDGANRFDTASLLELRRLLQRALQEEQDCVILTGEGNNFCLGGDLGELTAMTHREIHTFGRALTGALWEIADGDTTVIAAVNGPAEGGGLSIVEACDLAVGAETATFAIPEVRGGSPPVVSYASACRVLGRKAAHELALLATSLTAREAVERGLLNRVVPRERVLAECLELARAIRRTGSFCRREIKSLSRRMEQEQRRAQIEAAADRLTGVMLAGMRGGRTG